MSAEVKDATESAYNLSPLSEETRNLLMESSTATLATQLYKQGFRSRFVQGVYALHPGVRMVGVIRTLRYLPLREDLDTLPLWAQETNPQRRIAEVIRPGEVLMIDARQDLSAGTMGGMLISRMMQRGAAGLVSDGPFRDGPFIASLGWPTYSPGMNANTNLIAHHPEDIDVPIACGGVHVRPGDVAVGDDEGVIVIPRHLVEETALAAAKQEKEEQFIEGEILRGASIVGLYPMNAANRKRYEEGEQQEK